VHDETNQSIARLLMEMPFGPFPIALGVVHCDAAPAFESGVIEQNRNASAGKQRDLNALLRKGDTWMVEAETQIGDGRARGCNELRRCCLDGADSSAGEGLAIDATRL
jgi:hypothetical protein